MEAEKDFLHHTMFDEDGQTRKNTLAPCPSNVFSWLMHEGKDWLELIYENRAKDKKQESGFSTKTKKKIIIDGKEYECGYPQCQGCELLLFPGGYCGHDVNGTDCKYPHKFPTLPKEVSE